MKLNKLTEAYDDTEVPGGRTDPGSSVSKTRPTAERLGTQQMWMLAVYLSVEKDRDFREMFNELRRNPTYGPMIYNNLGRSSGIVKQLSNPISMQEVAQMFEKEFDAREFLEKWASGFLPDRGRFGKQFMLLYLAHRIRTGKKLKIEDVEGNPKGAMKLYAKYGKSNGILKYLARPEAIGELARMYQGNQEFAFNYFKHMVNAMVV